MSVSTENFIKILYNQALLYDADTRLGTLAGILNISNAASTDMARKLAAKNLVNYTKYKPLTLTESGKRLALKVLRKHRLWEAFLHQTLNLSLHEIHQEAENLEHLTSDFLADRIEEHLGYPDVDPHGDPIPATDLDTMADPSQITLAQAHPGLQYTVSRLFSAEKDFFDFCHSSEIHVGSVIRVDKQYDNGKMTEIHINGNKIILGESFSHTIYIKPITEN